MIAVDPFYVGNNKCKIVVSSRRKKERTTIHFLCSNGKSVSDYGHLVSRFWARFLFLKSRRRDATEKIAGELEIQVEGKSRFLHSHFYILPARKNAELYLIWAVKLLTIDFSESDRACCNIQVKDFIF